MLAHEKRNYACMHDAPHSVLWKLKIILFRAQNSWNEFGESWNGSFSVNFLKKNSWNQLIHKWNYISYWFHVISDTESKFPFFSTLYCALIFNEMEKFHLYSKIAISEQILKTFLKVMTLVSNLVLLTLDRPIPMIRYQMNVFVKYTSVIIVSHTVWKFRKLLKLCKENNTYIWFRKAGLSIKEKQKLNWF